MTLLDRDLPGRAPLPDSFTGPERPCARCGVIVRCVDLTLGQATPARVVWVEGEVISVVADNGRVYGGRRPHNLVRCAEIEAARRVGAGR